MSALFITLTAIAALFAILLFVKSAIQKDFCVICASVSLTWAGLLLLRWFGLFADETLLALLVGQSAVGAYYAVTARIQPQWRVFKLPLLLTLTLAGYALVRASAELVWPALFIAGLWGLSTLVYTYRHSRTLRSVVQKLITCCKNW